MIDRTEGGPTRRDLMAGGAALAAAACASRSSAPTPSARAPERARATEPGTHASFGSLEQIDAGVLNVGYAEAGPTDGPAAILLHGWPYDIHSYVDIAPILAAAGYRVIVPHLRGHGTTRFLSTETLRNAQQAVVALDILALMDALAIEKAILAGYNWGARTANIIAALWPDHCKAMVSVNGYVFSGKRTHRVVEGAGHNLPQEAPRAFAQAVIDVDGY